MQLCAWQAVIYTLVQKRIVTRQNPFLQVTQRGGRWVPLSSSSSSSFSLFWGSSTLGHGTLLRLSKLYLPISLYQMFIFFFFFFSPKGMIFHPCKCLSFPTLFFSFPTLLVVLFTEVRLIYLFIYF